MTKGMEALLEALNRAASGCELTMAEVRSLRFVTPDDHVRKFAEESWRRLVNFVDDIDVRSKDPAYDLQMKEEMMWRARKLASDDCSSD